MTFYHDAFDSQIQCEELFNTDPEELAEVMTLMAEDNFEGYGEWSAELEQSAWAGAVEVETENGAVMVKPQCERIGLHRNCTAYACKRAMREGGFDL